MRVLVLGGSAQASELAALLAQQRDVEAVLSLAGRTKAPAASPIPVRVGGFGGADGLAEYLETRRVNVLVDATHPFAEQITRNAAIAAARANVRLVVLSRPPWRKEPGDRWIMASDMAAAAKALPRDARRVFLTVGRLQIAAFEAAPQHFYLIRSIEALDPAPDLPEQKLILARGPFTLDDEERLLREEAIEIIVAKNSGGAAAHAKVEAARRLGLTIVMVERPGLESRGSFHNAAEALARILKGSIAHDAAPASRGV
ncbi:cobalt-precorrin-6A reductase [Methylocapsa palsarum]|uniref:Precorrin-6A/cobalt-precorrin-6A reductase n=1 Tax=Methylocapsa palsarum TaxID=1612308 RepID=A0A1I4C0K7_9HYPH|nr:cobalt-precorrin-6A reductase [Methylocapsa palsarum]SFK73736.1 precorrin-6A/cobalt-precorrin-6A reductase [Methylocapsa palsarum]